MTTPRTATETELLHKRAGLWMKRIRESRVTSTTADGKAKCMTQGELAAALQQTWYERSGRWRIWDDRDIRLLEAGEVAKVDRTLFEAIADALNTSPYERLLLIEAAGYATLSDFVLMTLGITPQKLGLFVIGPRSHRDLSVEEAIKLMQLQVRALLASVETRVRKLIEDLDRSNGQERGEDSQ